jgi:tellurite resistance protein
VSGTRKRGSRAAAKPAPKPAKSAEAAAAKPGAGTAVAEARLPAPLPVAAMPVAGIPVPSMPVASISAAPGLAHLPLPLLVLPMGLGGAGLAWRQATESLGAPALVGEGLLLLTALAWALLVGFQFLRGLRHPDAMLAEARHPVRVAFAAGPTIGLMILSTAAFPYSPTLGAALWCIAVPLHLVVAMLLLRRLLAGRGEAAMLAPPLLIPFVGSILAPAFGVRMGFVDASWMMFGVGLVMWLVLLPLLLNRLLVGPPLPGPMRPSLAIFLAPPAVGALALLELTGGGGAQAHGVALALVGVALLVAATLLSLAREFAATPFSLSWWGVTFPSAAFAVMLMSFGFHPLIGWLALALNTALTTWVAWRTWRAALAGIFLRPEAA